MSEYSLVVGGPGGNIGSYVVPHIARMDHVKRVTLIDHDRYERRNLASQDIFPGDVGEFKAEVQARRLSSINPGIHVDVFCDRVENMPLGRLKADVILGCFDNNSARQFLSEAAWRLSVPYVDGGVGTTGLMARVEVYVPGDDAPCLQCAWDSRDYDRLDEHYSCNGEHVEVAPTNGTSTVGALCASMLVIEAHKMLNARWEQSANGKQVFLDAGFLKHYVSRLRRNTRCRFDHETWEVEGLRQAPDEMTVKQALSHATDNLWDAALCLAVRGRFFFHRALHCEACGAGDDELQMGPRIPDPGACKACGGQNAVANLNILPDLRVGDLPPHVLERSLGSVGFRTGDVLSVKSSAGARYFELGAGEGGVSNGDDQGFENGREGAADRPCSGTGA